MRIPAFLMLPALAFVSAPALALDHMPAPTPLTLSGSPQPASARPRLRNVHRYSVHRRAGRAGTLNSSNGLIITDFKPDNHHDYAYLPHVSDLAYETDDYRNRTWRLKKVGPSSLVASVRYRF